MDTLEFSERLVKVLDEDELQEVLKKAVSRGFSVQGFKNPWKAPKPVVIKEMKQKKRGGEYYYMIILHAIADVTTLKNSQIVIQSMAKQWLQNNINKTSNKNVETDLIKLEEKIAVSTEEKKEVVSQSIASKVSLSEENEKLQKTNEEYKKKSKKLKTTIQGNKIEISNLKNEIIQLIKINKKIQGEYEKKKNEFEKSQSDYAAISQQIKEKDKYITELLEKIEGLNRYKECAPKILCFIKTNKEQIDFSGYNITFARGWKDAQKMSLENQQYDEIWIIHKGFSYYDIKEIKDNFSCTVREFLNVVRLKNKMGDRK